MKENKDDKKPISGEGIELYSRESSSDMLGDMPNWLIHTGSYIVYGLIAVLLEEAVFLNILILSQLMCP